MKDTHLRSIMKGLTWRVTATTTTVILAYLFFGDVNQALKLGLVEVFIKLLVYYMHERGWQLFKWGKV